MKEDGTKVPLDPSAPVYEVVDEDGLKTAVRTSTAMVSHFATCPKANLFSGKNKDKR